MYIDPTQLPYDHQWEFPRDKLRFGELCFCFDLSDLINHIPKHISVLEHFFSLNVMFGKVKKDEKI